MSKKFYITTPIYYVNARPHIGHTYTTIVCDTIARRQRMMGVDTYFLTGTDEHGQKIERSAAAAGCSPKEFADKVSAEFRGLWDRMKHYLRRLHPHHRAAPHARRAGAVHAPAGARLHLQGLLQRPVLRLRRAVCRCDRPGAPCPECGRPTETVQEENYFFKLSAMEDRLLKFYAEHPDFIRPETRRNEVIAFVRSGLRDLSVSRTTFKWGIPVPGDPKHVIYVWLDALANYITAIGFGSDDPKDKEKFEHYWPADVHMIGKEIVRFHCVYWPAFLLAAELPLPKSIVAHGWLLFEESKMSKSRGNIVRSETILDTLGADALRYFLLREIVFGQDGSFSFDALVQRYNADLANGLGNLSSRTLTHDHSLLRGRDAVPFGRARGDASTTRSRQLARRPNRGIHAQFERVSSFLARWKRLGRLVAAVNKYIVENEPWALRRRQTRMRGRDWPPCSVHFGGGAAHRDCAGASDHSGCDGADLGSSWGWATSASSALRNLKWGQLPARHQARQS